MKRLISVPELFELMKSGKKYVLLDCRFDLMNKNTGLTLIERVILKVLT